MYDMDIVTYIVVNIAGALLLLLMAFDLRDNEERRYVRNSVGAAPFMIFAYLFIFPIFYSLRYILKICIGDKAMNTLYAKWNSNRRMYNNVIFFGSLFVFFFIFFR